MRYVIKYHEQIVEDIFKLSASSKRQIKRSIEVKLTTKPELFGKPLRKSLKAYRSLRVGKYRVIYRIKKEAVLVLLIASRSKVYEEALNRQ